MTENAEKPFKIGTSPERDLAGSCQFGVNDAGTCEKIDTNLTQPCSSAVPRFRPHIDIVGNLAITAELEQVRARAAAGQLPAFRRGRMRLDRAGKVVVA